MSPSPSTSTLMIALADPYLEAFRDAGADHLLVHPEAGPHLDRTVRRIRELGAKAGVVFDPSTPPDTIQWMMDEIDIRRDERQPPGLWRQSSPSQLAKIRFFSDDDRRGQPRYRARWSTVVSPGRRLHAVRRRLRPVAVAIFAGDPSACCRKHRRAQGVASTGYPSRPWRGGWRATRRRVLATAPRSSTGPPAAAVRWRRLDGCGAER